MKINNAKELSIYIKGCRKAQKRTQTDVSDKIGVKQTTVSGFEQGCGHSKINTLFKIAHELGLVIEISTQAEIDNKQQWTEEW